MSRYANWLRSGVHRSPGSQPQSRLAPATLPDVAAEYHRPVGVAALDSWHDASKPAMPRLVPISVEQSSSTRNIVVVCHGIGTSIIYWRSSGPPPRTTFKEARSQSGTVLIGLNHDALFSKLLSVGILPRAVLRKILGNPWPTCY